MKRNSFISDLRICDVLLSRKGCINLISSFTTPQSDKKIEQVVRNYWTNPGNVNVDMLVMKPSNKY